MDVTGDVMRTGLLCLLCVLGAAVPNLSFATEVKFLPGDSFFHFYLHKSSPQPAEKEPWLVNYGQPRHFQPALCGHAGFWRLQMTGDTQPLWKGARHVYDLVRNKHEPAKLSIWKQGDGVQIETEINPVHVFVYNHDANFPVQSLAFKYNENWHKTPRNNAFFMLGKSAYRPFIKTPEAIVEDWYNSETYAPLNAKIPQGPEWWRVGEIIDQPIEIEASKIQLVLVHQAGLQRAASQNKNPLFWIVRADGEIDVCEWDRKEGNTIRRSLK